MQPSLQAATIADVPAPPIPAPQPATSAAPGAAPRTAQELAGLRQQRDELTEQLTGTHARRAELVGEMQSTDAAGQGVLRQQLTELDRRVLQLETDMSNTDHAIASAPPAVAASNHGGIFASVPGVGSPPGFVLAGPSGPSVNAVPVLLLLIVVLQVFGFVRGYGRRVGAGASDPALRDAAARLARVEHAVDAIAIEVERVSEGQRFVTRVLTESSGRTLAPHEMR